MPYPTLKVGSRGDAVRAAKAAYNRWNAEAGNTTPLFGPFFRRNIKGLQKAFGIPQTGVVGPRTWKALEPYVDDDGRRLLGIPVYIEPAQGFASLVDDLWEAYTIGRRWGFTDLGTYNPKSTLPGSGAASDHATSRKDGHIGEPACAFDLGITPAVGQANPAARAYFRQMIGRPDVHYVILGDKIWSTDKGIHQYTSGGHDGHIHVSGWRR